MTEARVFRVGIPPLFMINLCLMRYDGGAQATITIHIYKLGLHMGLSSID